MAARAWARFSSTSARSSSTSDCRVQSHCQDAPLIERQTVEQMMASPRDRSSAQDAPHLPPNEERRIIHQGLTDHYRRTLDEPIPSLGNLSPRKAAKTGKGREKAIDWLKMLENHSAQLGRDDPVGSYDFTWIWKELGLGDERRRTEALTSTELLKQRRSRAGSSGAPSTVSPAEPEAAAPSTSVATRAAEVRGSNPLRSTRKSTRTAPGSRRPQFLDYLVR